MKRINFWRTPDEVSPDNQANEEYLGEKIHGTWGKWENTKYAILDVRPTIEKGGEPFSEIMQSLEKVANENGLAIIVPFEPFPLYTVLEDRGWGYRIKKIGLNDNFILFRRTGKPIDNNETRQKIIDENDVKLIDGVYNIDVRQLEPPEPMAKVISLLSALAGNSIIKSIHDRKPVFLMNKLDQLGVEYEEIVIDENDEIVLMIIAP